MKEYYKSLTDFIKNIITALFVAELGMIGYFFTHPNNTKIVFYGIMINLVLMLVLFVMYLIFLENLIDEE
ncbi:hypothetical protein CQA53_06280 [Helicobacter didelphidarum]|uniref:Uncharacterized protein n=1 Tax=Helicobacter didelphidarum TaxID=2040648 RepID=A0A3D8IJ68_9HELI|nr:hypothetical protein [Helicobacter didelphidarum]RDU65377.1 hypothetical protein CQA53_06280 [Helicobacter didelphidarum]